MPEYEPVEPPVALTIAGSDSGGGAGIQADLTAMRAHGVLGTSVVTATTAQNTRGVEDVHPLPADHVASQYAAVADDFAVGAIKTGMLATAETVEQVTELVAETDAPLVVDPVMVAATGDRLLSPAAEDAYEGLIADATLVTPNADEAAVLTDAPVDTPADAERAGRELVALGADAALVKGGHLDGESAERDAVVDTLVRADDAGGSAPERVAPTVDRFETPRIDTEATHGSGCALSSAIAARLARGEPLRDAVDAAVAGMTEAVRRGYDVGEGPGAVNPTALGEE
ncbi:hydroxymethylpyrimidine/phosphomethylpyrimidine kinase [Halorubrum ezzemoulense]|jgi:hydroxymethylpyrimidine/phosphomethylpyrimidine kinase|uniref:Hydroxymethylpyrimidine/phosphomethylpyrimidine kinase n=2 Tax=Halorubrum ezzemoulense TaxID=337243 RepID=A0A238XM50_HALEZ|nr:MULTISPECIES: bifunctional hydroxymethylpyrimidine kinase/phosphomethylpyrimidine kinase [Halorubrum]MDB2238545.1 bifunctional hydroxymethylpyrimidine kinase/phosphomethylpyrimidine kinase [Halorubrum ezzemoulense]MDB2249176.1 bifunctional hydroxymethylpyrimidine kinase/phosphomethylpyrimidine kinase [Halorubrum ezzemoulense]MDB2261447.1 bifunctional hydroxymethylpyrimidine kinase/phosphomethylpyrimidine kinase [Halorubrum ezzemoulense]MDB2264429.1 bifunctional hydroxymethylpyrimidine kinase